MSDIGRLTFTALRGIPEVQPGADLAALVLSALSDAGAALRNGDVLVLAQKIVSKAEGRYVALRDVTPSPEACALAKETLKDPRLVELILRESSEIVRHRPNLIIAVHRLGFVMANAGIDLSNLAPDDSGERALLLPYDPDASAARIRGALETASGARIGVAINDSFGRPWRNGVTGVAIGVSGLPALIDRRGAADRHGRALQVTEIAAADELAAAASLLMGQADEGRPAILVRGFPYTLREGSAQELIRAKAGDLFR